MIQQVELDLGRGRILSLETGRVAREAGGAVVARLGDTLVLAAAVASEVPRADVDFFPLIVDFEEKLYAVGKIPGGFFKREGRPTETAILTARRVDRSLRPLFPEGFRNDVQIIVTPLSVDQDHPPDILAIIGASAALSISDIPFAGPIAAARVAKVEGEFIVDPTREEMQKSQMDLVVAATLEKVLMIECGAEEVSESDIVEGIKKAHSKIKEVIKLQEDLRGKAGKPKKEIKLYSPQEKIEKFVRESGAEPIKKALYIVDKNRQLDEIDKIKEELEEKIKRGSDEELKKLVAENLFDIKQVISGIEKEVVREMILKEKRRSDGRSFKEIRPLNCEVGSLPRAHGSAIFTRGQTQVLTVATLGAKGEEQRLEGLSPEEAKRFMHHYNFPSFSVGEVRPLRGPGRREIGHGALAERALLPVIPCEETFPYTIRLVSEVLGSNGSTSMASTCGSTLALMDAGVKIASPVAGISIGLIKENSQEILLTDIQGLEDHYGDMDFKVAGTKNGVTAIQVDIKIKGLSYDLITQALSQAKEARLFVLEKMTEALASPREELSPYAPRVTLMQIDPAKIGLVIGPAGKTVKKIIEETGVEIDIEDDGRIFITATESEGAKKAQKMIEDLTFEVKTGDIFRGKVLRIVPFGAFVEIAPGKEGLLHISEIAPYRVAKVEDELALGDEVLVKVIEIDDLGRYNLSRKAVTPQEKEKFRE